MTGLVLGLCVISWWLGVQAGRQRDTRDGLTVWLASVLVALLALTISLARILTT